MSDATPNATPIELLLIDDDQADIYLARRALKKCSTLLNIQVARDGEEALCLLRREGANAAAPRPDLIFLDLNMPRMTGHEFLEVMKADDDLKTIPTLIMSNSESMVDMQKSYGLHANAYLTKPVEPDVFADVIRSIEAHWFKVVRLPQRRDA